MIVDNEGGETGSADQQRRTTNGQVISTDHSNILSSNFQTEVISRDEDDDPLLRGLQPINIKFLKWQDSSLGSYVEFKIRVRYQEGPQEYSNEINYPGADSKPYDTFEWDIYKRFSNFSALQDQLLPYFKLMGQEAPKLPPMIDRSDRNRQQGLTKRKYELQEYMRKIIVMMIDRLPMPLITFLQIHEQAQLGFNVPEQLQLLTELNMNSCEVKVPRNTILVNFDGVPKVYYLVRLSYYPFQQPVIENKIRKTSLNFEAGEQKKICILKNFGDFKYLDEFVKASNLQLASGMRLPAFPLKRNATGQKKLGNEL